MGTLKYKTYLNKMSVILFISFFGNRAIAQNLVYNPGILMNYPANYLDSVRTADFDRFSYLVIKYMKSYKIDTLTALPKEYDPFYLAGFNLRDYEHNRLPAERFVRKYDKYGFVLTLLSEAEIANMVFFFKNNPSFIDYLEIYPPILGNTGNASTDLLIYRKKSQVWELCKF